MKKRTPIGASRGVMCIYRLVWALLGFRGCLRGFLRLMGVGGG